jgi:hypothetical protein
MNWGTQRLNKPPPATCRLVRNNGPRKSQPRGEPARGMPLYRLMCDRVRASASLHADEIRVPRFRSRGGA